MIRPINTGITSSGSQRYRCPFCKQTFTDTFDTIYYRWQVSSEGDANCLAVLVKEQACVVSVRLVDCPTTLESASSEPLVKKRN